MSEGKKVQLEGEKKTSKIWEGGLGRGKDVEWGTVFSTKETDNGNNKTDKKWEKSPPSYMSSRRRKRTKNTLWCGGGRFDTEGDVLLREQGKFVQKGEPQMG